MASTPAQLFRTFQASFVAQDALLARQLDRLRDRVITKYATGSANIASSVGLDVSFRLVFVRCHFVGGTGTADLVLELTSAQVNAYNAQLESIAAVGTGTDVFYTPGGTDIADPSSWSFQNDDQVRIRWTNPDAGNMTWGLEVGMAISA